MTNKFPTTIINIERALSLDGQPLKQLKRKANRSVAAGRLACVWANIYQQPKNCKKHDGKPKGFRPSSVSHTPHLLPFCNVKEELTAIRNSARPPLEGGFIIPGSLDPSSLAPPGRPLCPRAAPEPLSLREVAPPKAVTVGFLPHGGRLGGPCRAGACPRRSPFSLQAFPVYGEGSKPYLYQASPFTEKLAAGQWLCRCRNGRSAQPNDVSLPAWWHLSPKQKSVTRDPPGRLCKAQTTRDGRSREAGMSSHAPYSGHYRPNGKT